MLLEERNRMINELLTDDFGTREVLFAMNDEDLETLYNDSYEPEEDVEEEVDEVKELIVSLKSEIKKLVDGELPEWIVNILDDEIKLLAIAKYEVTPEHILELVEKLELAYEQC